MIQRSTENIQSDSIQPALLSALNVGVLSEEEANFICSEKRADSPDEAGDRKQVSTFLSILTRK